MFLVDKLLALPVTGPLALVRFLGERILEQIQREGGEVEDVEAEMLALETRFLLDEMNEEELARTEDLLLDRLDALLSG